MRIIKYGDLEIETDYVRPCNRKIFFEWYKDFWTIKGLNNYEGRLYLVGNVFEKGNDIDVRILVSNWEDENLHILASVMKDAIYRGFMKHHVFVDIFACKTLLTIDYMKEPGKYEDEMIMIGDEFILDGQILRKWSMKKIHDSLYVRQQRGVDEKFVEQMRKDQFFTPLLLEDVDNYIKNNFTMETEDANDMSSL